MVRLLKSLLMLCLFLFVSCDEYELDEDACAFCRGTGYKYCYTCLNEGTLTCPLCERGWEECDFCDDGLRWNGESYETCNVCRGNYMKICSRCKGNYLKVCQVCKGKKELCTACEGTGKKPGTEYVNDKWLK